MWRGWGEHISMIWVGGIYRAPVLHGSGSKLDPYFSYYWKQGENKAGLTDKKLTILIGEFSSGAIIFVLLKEMFKLKIVIFKFAHILFKINNVTVWKRLGSGSKYFRIRIPVLCQFFLSYRRGSGTIICDSWRFVCFDREHLPLLDAGPALPLHQPVPGHRQPPLQVSYTSIF